MHGRRPLFPAQQATEKHLKAFLLSTSAEHTEDSLRRAFRHDIAKLIRACANIDVSFKQVAEHEGALLYGSDVRYRRSEHSCEEVIDTINLSFAVCNLVATKLLRALKATC